jgi:hypothetical protein
MPNGRCRMHGGLSTGPRTPKGKARSAAANWKHGRESKAAIQERREARETSRMLRYLLKELGRMNAAWWAFTRITASDRKLAILNMGKMVAVWYKG